MENNHILYFIKIKWYNEYANTENGEPEEPIDYFYAFAPSFSNLATRIENQFPNILDVKITEINCMCGPADFLYVHELTKQERKKIEDCNVY